MYSFLASLYCYPQLRMFSQLSSDHGLHRTSAPFLPEYDTCIGKNSVSRLQAPANISPPEYKARAFDKCFKVLCNQLARKHTASDIIGVCCTHFCINYITINQQSACVTQAFHNLFWDVWYLSSTSFLTKIFRTQLRR